MLNTYVRFDSSSVPHDVLNHLVPSCGALHHVVEHDYLMSLDPARFTHAHLVLGSNPNRYGADLSPHLVTVIDFFSKAPKSKFISLNFGTSDFKRRHSEDLGVAMASLLMVDLFSIDWATICQIPENRKLSKKRPDFEGFNCADERFLYEAKGTCRLETVIPTIEKAIGQVKNYPEPALRKIAIASYFCSNPRAFPSFSFFVDPELPDIVPPDQEHARQLHIEKVLEYVGCKSAASSYLKYLAAKFALEKKKSSEYSDMIGRYAIPSFGDNKISAAFDEFRESFEREANSLESIAVGNRRFHALRRVVSVDDEKYECVAGLDSEVIFAIMEGNEIPNVEPMAFSEPGSASSQFSDGTIFQLRNLRG